MLQFLSLLCDIFYRLVVVESLGSYLFCLFIPTLSIYSYSYIATYPTPPPYHWVANRKSPLRTHNCFRPIALFVSRGLSHPLQTVHTPPVRYNKDHWQCALHLV